jgi:ferritin
MILKHLPYINGITCICINIKWSGNGKMANQKALTDDKTLSEVELNLVRRLFTTLLLTVKNLTLYPEGHGICKNSINQFYTQLTAYINKFGKLRFEIEREQVVCRDGIIVEGIPEEGSLHHTLFRDGISWLEFTPGVEQKEVSDLLLIINRYIKLSAEPEGDIVTALWENPFPHILYEVTEFFSGSGNELEDFNDIVSGRTLTINEGAEMREKAHQADPPIDLLNISLTPDEEMTLKEMVLSEEEADITSYLDALLDSLLQQKEEDDFSKILDVLSEEFTLTLGRRDFDIGLKILMGLQYIRDICREDLPWSEKLISGFYASASGKEALAPLNEIWEQIETDDAAILYDIFILLDSRAIHTLLSLLSKPQSDPKKKVLLDAIVHFASSDISALELAINNAGDNLLERLVSVLLKMDNPQSLKYLQRLSHHSSGSIRYTAIKGILKIDPGRIKEMFNLIVDKEDSIRQLVLAQMESVRDPAAEEFLVSYLKKIRATDFYANHLIQCFRILGKCGSARSVPFLKDTLLKWGFLAGSKRAVIRTGAAIALGTLGLAEADKVLDAAKRSMFPGIRKIAGSAIEELSKEVPVNDR